MVAVLIRWSCPPRVLQGFNVLLSVDIIGNGVVVAELDTQEKAEDMRISLWIRESLQGAIQLEYCWVTVMRIYTHAWYTAGIKATKKNLDSKVLSKNVEYQDKVNVPVGSPEEGYIWVQFWGGHSLVWRFGDQFFSLLIQHWVCHYFSRSFLWCWMRSSSLCG